MARCSRTQQPWARTHHRRGARSDRSLFDRYAPDPLRPWHVLRPLSDDGAGFAQRVELVAAVLRLDENGMVAFTLRPVAEDDVEALQLLLESDPGYTERVTGYPPGPSDALSLLVGRPEDVADDDKLVFGGWSGRSMISVVEVLRHWPAEGTAHIGLLLVDGRHQGQGLGRRTLDALYATARAWEGLNRWRISVVRTNDHVLSFWSRMGYVETGELKPYRYGSLESEAIILTRPA